MVEREERAGTEVMAVVVVDQHPSLSVVSLPVAATGWSSRISPRLVPSRALRSVPPALSQLVARAS